MKSIIVNYVHIGVNYDLHAYGGSYTTCMHVAVIKASA
jgi:hypothetical protein